AAGSGGDAVFVGQSYCRAGPLRRQVRPGPHFKELEGGFDPARFTTVQTAVMPLIDGPAALRTLLRRGAGPLALHLPAAVEQLGLREALLRTHEREQRPQDPGLLLHTPLEVRNRVAEVADFALRLVQLAAVGSRPNRNRNRNHCAPPRQNGRTLY